MSALLALVRLRDPRSLEPLVRALRHPDSGVRSIAAEALGKLGDPRAITPLVEALADCHGRDDSGLVCVRRATAKALAKLGEIKWNELAGIADPVHGLERLATSRDSRLLTPLLDALRDSHSFAVRADAATALGGLGDPRAVQPLIAATQDPAWDVQRNALEALGGLEDDAGFEVLRAEAQRGSHFAVTGLTRFGEVRGAEAVIEVLDHWRHQGPADDAYWLLRALGQIGGERAFRHLEQEVESGEPEAIWPLARAGDPRSVDVLIRRLRNHDPAGIGDSGAVGVANAAGALATLGDARAVEPLIHALEDLCAPPLTAEDFYRAEARRKRMLLRVVKALGELADPRATTALRRLTKDQPEEIGEEAAWALTKLQSREVQGSSSGGGQGAGLLDGPA